MDKKILIIDDEKAINENLVIFLEDEGFDVSSVEDAETALKKLESGEVFKIAIVDIRLPGMSGDEFILKAKKISPKTEFIVHTGSNNFSLSPGLIEAGLSGKNVFRKPIFDLNLLVDKIKELAC